MTVGYHINHEEGIVTITGTDAVHIDEASELGRQLLADHELDRALPHLVDLRGLQLERTEAQSKLFREFVLGEYSSTVAGSIAIVIDDSLDDISCADLYHLTCSMDRAELFDHYEQAMKWLMRREFA